EVPARDVVRVAVAVVVDALRAVGADVAAVGAALGDGSEGGVEAVVAGEGGDHVLGVDDAVAVGVGDARVGRVIGGVEHAVVVDVVVGDRLAVDRRAAGAG